MVKFILKDSFYDREGEYEILESTELNEKFSIVLATENNKAVVYLKHFTGKVEKVAEFENPTADEKETFFTNQFNYWLLILMENMNKANLSDLLDSKTDCSFDYYFKYTYFPSSFKYRLTVILEKGKVYVFDGENKILIDSKSRIQSAIYFDILVKKAAIENGLYTN